MSDSLGLVNSVVNLADGQMIFWGEFKLQKKCNQSCSSNLFKAIDEMTFGLVHASYSLRGWQAVKLTFFAPCLGRLCQPRLMTKNLTDNK